jgi:hypothetical protein
VNGFPVRQKHHSQPSVIHFGYPGPTADAPILLNIFSFRAINGTFYPLFFDYGTVRSNHAGFEVIGGFHPFVLTARLQHRNGLVTTNQVGNFCLT